MMVDNASSNINKIQDNITTNTTCVNKATKIKMKEILSKKLIMADNASSNDKIQEND